jgi:hypothetical protein
MLSGALLSVIILKVILLFVSSSIMLSGALLSVIILKVILLFVSSSIMLSGALLSIIILKVILLFVSSNICNAECRYVECHSADCRGAKHSSTPFLKFKLSFKAEKFTQPLVNFLQFLIIRWSFFFREPK